MKFTQKIKQPIIHLLFSIFIALIVVFVTEFFVNAFLWVNHLWLNQLGQPSIAYLIVPVIGALMITGLLSLTKQKRAYNHVDIISSIHTSNARLDEKSNSLSILASLVSLSSGFSVGYYGPVLQLGSVLGSFLGKFRALIPASHQYVYVGAGAAAAIASIFHTPIGAVVFVHEVLFSFFSIRAFAPVATSAVTAYVASTKIFGDGAIFPVVPHLSPDIILYLLVAISGLLAGVLGVSFTKVVSILQTRYQARYPLIYRALLSAVIVMGLGYFFPEIFSASIPFLKALLAGEYQDSAMLLLLILFAKFIATSFGIGLGIPGGIFGPSVFFGAVLGAFLSVVCHYFYPEMDWSILLITTMAASMSVIMGAPIAMIIIATELTNDYALSGAVMLSIIMANIISFRLLGVGSFSDVMLSTKGLNLSQGRDQLYLKTKDMLAILSNDYLVIKSEVSLLETRKILIKNKQEQACVVDDCNIYLGMIFLIDIENVRLKNTPEIDQLKAVDLTSYKKAFYKNTSIWEGMLFMHQFHGEIIAVVDSSDEKTLCAVIYERDLIKYYFDTIDYLRKQENISDSF